MGNCLPIKPQTIAPPAPLALAAHGCDGQIITIYTFQPKFSQGRWSGDCVCLSQHHHCGSIITTLLPQILITWFFGGHSLPSSDLDPVTLRRAQEKRSGRKLPCPAIASKVAQASLTADVSSQERPPMLKGTKLPKEGLTEQSYVIISWTFSWIYLVGFRLLNCACKTHKKRNPQQ